MPPIETRPSRERILMHLRQHGRATAGQLAEVLGVSAEAVRLHLTRLQRDGLVLPPERRLGGGRGRPSHAYRIAPAALSLLPRNHTAMLTHLVAAISQSSDEQAIRSLMAEGGRHYAATIGAGWPVSAGTRRALTLRFLESAGYLPQWDGDSAGSTLRFGHCPYAPLSQAQPGLCAFDEALLARLLGRQIHLDASIARLDGECVMAVGKALAFDSLLAF